MAERVHGILVASTKATKTVTAEADKSYGSGQSARTLDLKVLKVRCVNHGPSGVIYATTDGTDPTVRGDDTWAIPPGGFLDLPLEECGDSQVVELISESTPEFSLEAISGRQA